MHLPRKLLSNADLALKIIETSYFAQQNHRAFILCSAKLWNNADFAPQNHGDIVSGAKITTKIILIYIFISFFLIFVVNQSQFRDFYNHQDRFLKVPSHEIFCLKKWSYWLYRSLKLWRLEKNITTEKIFLDDLLVYLGPLNYVSMRKRAYVAMLQNSAGHTLK